MSRTMLAGMISFGERCQPAPSMISKAIAPALTHVLISAKYLFIASTLTVGSTNALPTPRAGQIAPNI
jgi:hypothetical protein